MRCLALLLVLSVGVFVCEAKLRAAGVRLGPSPGLMISFKKAAMDKIVDGACSLSHYSGKIPFPDAKADVGGVSLETKNARMTKMTKPKINYTFQPPNTIRGDVEFPHIGIQSRFNAARRTFVSTQTDQGLVTFNCSKVQVSFSLTLGEFENGIPNVDKFECDASLGPANLNIKEAKYPFAKDVLGVWAKAVRPGYNSLVCPTARKLVTTKLNSLLRRIPNVLDLGPNLSIKYQVKPSFTNDAFEARFFAKTITDQASPFVPAKFEPAECPNADVIILVSPAIFNDVLFQAYVNDKIRCNIDSKTPLASDLVTLDCKGDQVACLGNIAPALAEKFGRDASTKVEMRATKAPEVSFEKGKATFTGALSVALTFTTANDSKEYHEATAAVDISGEVKLRIHNKTIYGQVEITDTKVHIDEEHNQKWETKISDTIKKVVQNYINGDFLSKGLKLKLPFGAGFTDPIVQFNGNTFVICSGFEYEVDELTGEKKK
jgi:hypothetical protein